jgi:UDP-glucose 4-epimerase
LGTILSTWLVTGGAGYIGAHVVKSLINQDFKVIVVDDLSTGLERKIPKSAIFEKIDIAKTKELSSILKKHQVEGVIHLAAKKAVGESMINPSLYYQENIGGLISLLEAMSQANVKKIVYSSSAAVYGTPKENKVSENSETIPQSPYGETKLVGEWLLKADEKARQIKWIALRYFNVVGAANPELGDTGVNNLVPMVFRALQNNERPKVFGDDYSTKDGSCIRDYIHVSDLAEAHVIAAQKLSTENYCGIINIGRGEGFSVKEVMNTISEVIGKDVNYEISPRRAGDPTQTIADVTKSSKDLKWKAQNDLKSMIISAWQAWQLMPPSNK